LERSKNLSWKIPVVAVALLILVAVFVFRYQSGVPGFLFTGKKPVLTGNNYIVPSINYRMVRIPAGSFVMGSPVDEDNRDNDERQHTVTLTEDFYLGVTEVTQEQWRKIMGYEMSEFPDCGADCPAENISYHECLEFVRGLNKLEGVKGYRLPTEAEWEYACRAGSKTAFAGGEVTGSLCEHDFSLEAEGWYCGNAGHTTHPGAEKEPNAWGIYDMHGNVWEWCQDWYGEYPSVAETDPKGPHSGFYRVLRGGCWDSTIGGCRSASRGRSEPDFRLGHIGLRLAGTP